MAAISLFWDTNMAVVTSYKKLSFFSQDREGASSIKTRWGQNQLNANNARLARVLASLLEKN